VQNVTIPCRSHDLLPFLPVIYLFLRLFSTNYSSILPHFILASISWPTSWSCCFQIHIQYSLGNYIFFPFSVHVQTNVIYVGLLFDHLLTFIKIKNYIHTVNCVSNWGLRFTSFL
jgi:hypothetical protein